MRAVFVAALVAALVALGVPHVTVLHAQASGSVHANHTSMPMPQSDVMTALLTDPLGSRGSSGTATVRGTSVQMNWSGDQPSAKRVWSVRRGSCSHDEGVVGVAGAYPPITVDASGSATGSATLVAPLATDGPFHVLVQTVASSRSAGASATTLVCGTLGNGAAPARAAVTELTTSPNGSKPQAIDHSTMDHSMMNASGVGVSRGAAGVSSSGMNMSGMNMSGMNISGMGATDTSLMAIHMRMMADPVIRERVMTDPVLQRMMAQMPGMSSTMGMNTEIEMPGTADPPAGSRAASGAKATSTTAKPAAKRATKPAARAVMKPATQPATKPAAKPAPAAMPGMDHSKMPGMRKPPA